MDQCIPLFQRGQRILVLRRARESDVLARARCGRSSGYRFVGAPGVVLPEKAAHGQMISVRCPGAARRCFPSLVPRKMRPSRLQCGAQHHSRFHRRYLLQSIPFARKNSRAIAAASRCSPTVPHFGARTERRKRAHAWGFRVTVENRVPMRNRRDEAIHQKIAGAFRISIFNLVSPDGRISFSRNCFIASGSAG